LDNDKEITQNIKQPTTIWTILSYIASGLFFIGGIGTIFFRFWEGVICLIIGFTLLPQGHKWIESTLVFKFNWTIKTVFVSILILILIPVSQNYTKQFEEIKAKEMALKEKADEEERIRKLEIERKEKERLDSLNYYSSKADEKIKLGQFKSAIANINLALKYADSQSELIQKRAELNFRTNQFNDAIVDYSTLINSYTNKRDNYFRRATCYQRLNNKKEAVSDLKQAIELGSNDAKLLHDKINPIKRRLTGYVTLCCDGTTTSRKGRGTCSRHDGVCNWNHPVYEEYREF
jgi:tetratricopeptide (TPR) repeat protein